MSSQPVSLRTRPNTTDAPISGRLPTCQLSFSRVWRVGGIIVPSDNQALLLRLPCQDRHSRRTAARRPPVYHVSQPRFVVWCPVVSHIEQRRVDGFDDGPALSIEREPPRWAVGVVWEEQDGVV